MKKIFLSETIRLRALIFGMLHHLVDLYQVCSNYAPGAKMAPHQMSPGTWSAFNRYLSVSFKQNSERFWVTLPPCFVLRPSLLKCWCCIDTYFYYDCKNLCLNPYKMDFKKKHCIAAFCVGG